MWQLLLKLSLTFKIRKMAKKQLTKRKLKKGTFYGDKVNKMSFIYIRYTYASDTQIALYAVI